MEDQEIEKLLAAGTLLSVKPGRHQSKLESELLNDCNLKERPMMNRRMRLAWATFAALALVATAWGAQRLYRTYIVESGPRYDVIKQSDSGRDTGPKVRFSVISDTTGTVTIGVKEMETGTTTAISLRNSSLPATPNMPMPPMPKVPPGSTAVFHAGETGWHSDDPKFTDELGRKQLDEIIRLAAVGKAKFLRKTKSDQSTVLYSYQFTLADGHEVNYSSPTPPDKLKQVNEWKLQDQQSERIMTKVERVESAYVIVTSKILPDGRELQMVSAVGPNSILGEIPELVKQGKLRFLNSRKFQDGRTLYIYEFTLSNSGKGKYGVFDNPLPNVKSAD